MQQGVGVTFPAASLLVLRRGKTFFHRAYGWLDPERKAYPASIDTRFDLASLTKIFTATAFMTLVDRGFVALDDPVSSVIPEFGGLRPVSAGMDPHTKKPLAPDPRFAGMMVDASAVTFRQLLTHTSGLAAWIDMCRGAKLDDPIPLPHEMLPDRPQRLAALLQSPTFIYPPERRYVYSDLGFMILSVAIERLTALSLPDYLQQAVLSRLEMDSIIYNPLAYGLSRELIAPTEFCAWRRRRVWGEVHDENAACLGGVSGHAGLFGAAADVAALGQAFLAKNGALLSPELMMEMTREQVRMEGARRGLGWQLPGEIINPVGNAFSARSFGHTGFTGTSLWIEPELELVVALLTNRVYYGRDPQPIADFRITLHQTISELLQ